MRKGSKHSKESIEKNRLKHLGKPSTSNTKFIKGIIPWMKGKKHTEESIKKNRIAHLGIHSSPSTEFKKGMIPWIKGKKGMYSDEVIKRIKESRALQVFPIRDTMIEIKIQDYLNQLNISFNTHRQLDILHSYQTDIFIPSLNLVIECDGDYWYANPLKFPNPSEQQKKQIEKDNVRTKELKDKGYNIIRLWESDINNMSIEDFKSKLDKR
jgi:very-short-patch-repair endonuclease